MTWRWEEWLILIAGAGGIALAQTESLQQYACFLGGAGQIAWFRVVDRRKNPGVWLNCVVYASVWLWGFLKFWVF